MNYSPLIFIPIGFGHAVCANRVKMLTIPNSKPGRRIIKMAKENGVYFDASGGHSTKTIICMDDGTFVACALSPKTVFRRFQQDHTRLVAVIEQQSRYAEALQYLTDHFQPSEVPDEEDPDAAEIMEEEIDLEDRGIELLTALATDGEDPEDADDIDSDDPDDVPEIDGGNV